MTTPTHPDALAVAAEYRAAEVHYAQVFQAGLNRNKPFTAELAQASDRLSRAADAWRTLDPADLIPGAPSTSPDVTADPPRLPQAVPADVLSLVRTALTQAAALGHPGAPPPGDVARALHLAHQALSAVKPVDIDVVDTAQLRARLRSAEDRLDHMESLRVEYTPAAWTGETGYVPGGMDLPPYMYSWSKLDEMMGEVGREVDHLTQQHVTEAYVGQHLRHVMSLYRHMIRTLCARTGQEPA
ncbi:hypothetical protein [Deinococcus soli (ex Cha et al. 2016)]|uniref:Uncharacterized protein n=2 Tax=Deinococcus soli (ex Cha et al. 2016) TaxID=1309411 RepID=A0ACC6KKE2_9DEIO|nr:hypothetical protein [Deinococcus soli (ex Cha et al. 2016)]MDR6218597.1 hypothetical protein [Deinococcus soli (ex Cha et al. 2016)]MDR6328394.1 hypothetical protein [Deinococcus soli (ex Cha et al. 2016)]MDR6753005.1 hypothetical protein [Deinococcus soli (ex Cha et al. 2016)]